MAELKKLFGRGISEFRAKEIYTAGEGECDEEQVIQRFRDFIKRHSRQEGLIIQRVKLIIEGKRVIK